MPHDMVVYIVRFLPFLDVLSSRLVASSWAGEEVAHTAADNNAEFDLQLHRWPPRPLKFWSTYSRLFGRGVKRITFDNDEERTIPTSSLRSILDACPNVKSISIEQFFEKDGLQTLSRYTTVEELAFEDSFETEDDMIGFLRSAPHLTSLTYRCSCWNESLLSSSEVIRAAPNLQCLTIIAKEGSVADASSSQTRHVWLQPHG